MQSTHLACGGRNIAKTTRKDLLRMNAPIRVSTRKSKLKSKMACRSNGFRTWFNAKLKKQDASVRVSRDEYRLRVGSLKSEWAGFSAGERLLAVQQVVHKERPGIQASQGSM